MSNKDFGSWPRYGGQKVVLDNDPRLTPVRYGSTTGVPLKLYLDAGFTVAGGGITFTLPTGYFATVIAATATARRDTADPTLACFALVRSASISSAVVQVFESKTSGVLLGGYTEGLETSGTGIYVNLIVFGT